MSTKRAIPPKEVVKNDSGGGKEVTRTHPAFGTIGASRVTSGGEGYYLFGSPIRHHGFIEITIRKAQEHHSLHHSRQFGYEPIMQVIVSESQWATFVSTLNMGTGTPCTLNYFPDGKIVDQPAIIDKDWRAKVDQDIRRSAAHEMEKLMEVKRLLDDLMKKPSIRKGDLERVQTLFLQAVEHAPSNYQFMADQVTHHVDDLVTSAKADISGYITRVSMQFPQLEGHTPEVPRITDATTKHRNQGGMVPDDGGEAWRLGWEDEDCPYALNSPKANEWHQQWRDAKIP